MFKSIITDQLNMDFEKALIDIVNHGYKYIEIHSLWGKTIEELSNEEINTVLKLLKKYNLEVSCLSSTLFFMCPLYPNYEIKNFKSTFLVTQGNYEDHIEKLKRTCETAKKLNAKYVRLFPFRASEAKKVVGTDEDIKFITEKLILPSRLAEEMDITLVLENCPYTHLPKGIMTKKVIDNINSPNLKLLWDIGNSFRAPIDKLPVDYRNVSLHGELEIISKCIGHVHLKDYIKENNKFSHITFSEGNIDFKDLFRELNLLEYSGSVSLEPEVDYNNVIKSMENLNKILDIHRKD